MDYQMTPGDIYIFNPNDPHRIVSNEESGFITVHILREVYKHQFPDLKDMYAVCQPYGGDMETPDPELNGLRFLMAKLWQEYNKNAPGEQMIFNITGELIEMLLEDFTFYTYKKKTDGELELVRQSASTKNLTSMNRYYHVADQIFKRFQENLQLSDLAAEIFLSQSHLSRSLKGTVGLTFSELLSLARSEEAERLLFTTDKNVDEIANQVGFANRKHLALNFKKWFHKTPTEFRNAVGKDQSQSPAPVFEELDQKKAKQAILRWLDGK
jgi:xylan 1,4-beta-xylosidase